MPTLISHGIVGIAAGAAFSDGNESKRFWALSLLCPLLPDADVIAFRFGIPYSHFLGHRGFLHALFFAFVLGVLVTALFYRKEKYFSSGWWRYALFFALLTSTHGILDAFTNGGLGIALLAPFDNTRYFFWETPIEVSPLSLERFISARGISVLKSEMIWVWLPTILIAVLIRTIRINLIKSIPAYWGAKW